MKSFIPDHILEEVRGRADIVEVISDYVPLKSSGRNFKGLCPFHQEKTPSFTANREKQIYYCFGCGAGGNAFKFLMEMEDLPFIEVVRRLASRYQVALPETPKSSANQEAWNQKEVLFKLNSEAVNYYTRQLFETPEGQKARDYLKSRGISDEIARKFKLGWAPDQWHGLLNYLRKKEKASPDHLVSAGLVVKKEKENGEVNYYDRFRGRLMFPIFDGQARAIGFGGRVLGEGEPKYLNTSETPVYRKGQVLYGQHLAKEAYRKQDRALIVEGYFDVIQCHQAGIENAVATCGTALTPSQCLSIKHFTQNAVLLFDSDKAGKSAADRGFDVLLAQGLTVSVAALPAGEDPDSFLSKGQRTAFLQCVDQAPPFLDYRMKRAIEEGQTSTLEGKLEIVNQLLPFLAKVPNSVERTEWVRKISDRLNVDDRGFLDQLKKTLAQNRTRIDAPKETSNPTLFNPEFFILQLMFAGEELARDIRQQVEMEEFSDPLYREVATKAFEMLDEGGTLRVDRLMDRIESIPAKSELSRMALSPLAFDNLKRAVLDCISSLKRRPYRDKLKTLQGERGRAFHEGRSDESKELNHKVLSLKENLVPGLNSCI